ncbi:MAG: aminotransferase class III-fold pyridoxal phosphate-dependent enzyme [Hyphomicrobiaceae bacterium]|nr:MAG: aminotransferase class III-fold pyridoxal phosphate-dependent enzyme [Hyphomicrobiaceae bacterium]
MRGPEEKKVSEDFAALQARHLMQCWSSQRGYRPLPVRSASGCWIETTDGRRIFDLRSAHECINLGFRHPKVLDAMRRQMESVVYVTDDFATEPTAKLAAKLARITPGGPDKKVFFCQSGAAAIEAAIKGARQSKYVETFKLPDAITDAPQQYPYPYKIISRYRSWHGATYGATSASGDPRRWFAEPLTMPGVVFAPDADAYRSPFGDGEQAVAANLRYLDYLIEQEGGSNKVAAMLIETVVGSNGIIPPPPVYIRGLRALCDKWRLLLIADETMTGMGRTGRMFAFEHYDIVPDIVVMGKALGAYCPMAAVIFSEAVSRTFDDHIFGHGQSFSGHALGAAAALASIEVLEEEGLITRSAALGRYLGNRLREIGRKHASVGDVRGLGLFWTIELVAHRETKKPLRRATEKYEHTIVKDVSDYLFREKNIYVPSDKFGVWVVPPLVVTKEEIDMIVAAIDDSLRLADDWLEQNRRGGPRPAAPTVKQQ